MVLSMYIFPLSKNGPGKSNPRPVSIPSDGGRICAMSNHANLVHLPSITEYAIRRIRLASSIRCALVIGAESRVADLLLDAGPTTRHDELAGTAQQLHSVSM